MKTVSKGVWAEFRGRAMAADDVKLYEQFRRDGGTTGGYGLDDVPSIQRDLQRVIDVADGKKLATALNWAEHALAPIKGLNEVFENSTRFAAYKASLEHGLSREQAAVIAKNLTVNFNKRGEASPMLNALYAFFNASMQANATVIRAAARSRYAQAAIVGLIGAGVAQEYFGSQQKDAEGNETLDYATEFERDRNVVIPFGEYRLKMPIAYGFNVAFTAGRRLTRAVVGKETVPHAIAGVMAAAFDAFSPIHSFVPTFAEPMLDVATNTSFSGHRIAKQNDYRPDLPASSQHYDSANKFFVAMAEGLNSATGGDLTHKGVVDVSPEKTDYLLQQYLGGPFQFIERLANLAAPPSGHISVDDVPVVRRFAGEKYSSYDAGKSAEIFRSIDQRDKELRAGSTPAPGELQMVSAVKAQQSLVDKLERERSAVLKLNKNADVSKIDQDILAAQRRAVTAYNAYRPGLN
jgi:hypothetical protein